MGGPVPRPLPPRRGLEPGEPSQPALKFQNAYALGREALPEGASLEAIQDSLELARKWAERDLSSLRYSPEEKTVLAAYYEGYLEAVKEAYKNLGYDPAQIEEKLQEENAKAIRNSLEELKARLPEELKEALEKGVEEALKNLEKEKERSTLEI